MPNKSSLHPFDARRKRNQERHAQRMSELFGRDYRNRSQDQKQAEHAAHVAEEQRKKKERDDSLWITQPRSNPVAPSRVAKFHRKQKKEKPERPIK